MNRTSSSRLLGQETEYAIRFSPGPGQSHPGNSLIYRALRHGIRKFVKIKNGDPRSIQEQFFTENGGAFSYEHFLHALDSGLIEGATPECRGAGELLLYQRALDRLLTLATPAALLFLERRGFKGTLGVLKNCRDAEGHVYGAQENYEARVGRGAGLWCYRVATLCAFPPVLALMAGYWLAGMSVLASLLVLAFVVVTAYGMILATANLLAFFIPLPAPRFVRDLLVDGSALARARVDALLRGKRFRDAVARAEFYILVPLQIAALWPYTLGLRMFAFRAQRRAMSAFMVTRTIFTGAGTLLEDGRFVLSEKGTAIRRLARFTAGPEDRPLFDSGNLHKALLLAGIDFFFARFWSFARLLGARQRMQIGFSESNRCEIAEYLKIGTTLLVLEMAESGFLRDPPRLRRPVRALRSVVFDPALEAKLRLRGGTEQTALQIQRHYLSRAREFLRQGGSVSIEFHEIVRLWDEVLAALETDPARLIGRVDWVTKRYLLETAGAGGAYAVKKKIDLAYHELGTGYYEILESEGLTARLTTPEDVERAIHEPSSPARVRLRSRLVRDVLYRGEHVAISWNSARIGRFWNRRVVSLDEFRKK